MKGVRFPEANVDFSAPPGMEEQVYSLPVLIPTPIRENELRQMISCWELEPGELEEIQRTGRIWLSVIGHIHPPVNITAEKPFTTGTRQ